VNKNGIGAAPIYRDPGRPPTRSARVRINLLATLALALAAAASIAACGGGSESGSVKAESASEASLANVAFQPEGTPKDGGVLTFARPLQPTSLNPWAEPNTANNPVELQIFDNLVEATPDPAKFAPGLAKSWSISADNLVYTFKLRPAVKFSDGQPLRASDVKFSLDTAADPELDPVGATLLESIESVSTPNPSTVEIRLSKVTPAFLADLTTVAGLIVPQKGYEEAGAEDFGFHPIGTGPFMVEKFSPGDPELVLKKNPYYWKEGLPHLAGVNFKFIASDNARMLAAESGSVDVAEGVPFAQVDRIAASTGVELVQQHLFATDWIFVNGCKAPLNDKDVRQALLYATPLEQISETVFHGLAPVAATANLPTKYLDQSIKPYPYDPEKAKQLLKKSGNENLSLTMVITSGDSVATQLSTILQAAWAKAGVDLKVEQKDFNSTYVDLENGNYELANTPPTAQVSDVPVDDEFDYFVANSSEPSAYPWGCWDNPDATALIGKAISTPSEEKRQQYFSEYQKILHDEQPVFGIVHVPNLFAVRTNVHNFVAVGTGWALLDETWLE
jgi:peptide/nickel transport system substrate-binding protein